MVIASGHVDDPLAAIAHGARCTWFLTPANPVTARKKWIAGSLEPKGTLTHRRRRGRRAAARQEPAAGRCHAVDGAFERGDAVVIRGPDGRRSGAGSSPMTPSKPSKIRDALSDINILGFTAGRDGAPDDLVIGGSDFLEPARDRHYRLASQATSP